MRNVAIGLVTLGLFTLVACSDDNNGGDGDASAGTDGQAALDGTNAGGDGNATATDGSSVNDGARITEDGWIGTQPACAGTVTQCNDGKDNEDPPDGLIDEQDPECVGPCDDDESSFATGLPGDNVDCKKQDCFFDGNSGQGEGCEWNLGCDPNGEQLWTSANCNGPYKAVEDPAKCEITQSDLCKDVCLPLTPNGCDCFGCCTVFVNDEPRNIFLGSTDCSLEALENGDTTACAECTPRGDCVNECGECELCLGKSVEDLPASCISAPDAGTVDPDAGTGAPDGGADPCSVKPTCESGWLSCVPGCNHCLATEYCITGCCIPFGLQ